MSHVDERPGKIASYVNDINTKAARGYPSRRDGKIRSIQLPQERDLPIRTNVEFDMHEVNTENMPPATTKPIMETVSLDAEDSGDLMIFDLETTCTGHMAEITQLAAVSWDGKFSFDQYVMPQGDISYMASEITGLTVARVGGKRTLLHHGKEVESHPMKKVLLNFLQWLDDSQDQSSQRVVLIAHNAGSFDMPILIREAKRCQMSHELAQYIKGFMDTLPAFRKSFPGLASYSQGPLVKHFVHQDYDAQAHDALKDVGALQRLLQAACIQFDILKSFTYTLESATKYVDFLDMKRKNLYTFRPLSLSLSKYMLDKIAGSGLTYQNLQLAFSRGESEGLLQLLTEKNDMGKPRVTTNSRILRCILSHFANSGSTTGGQGENFQFS